MCSLSQPGVTLASGPPGQNYRHPWTSAFGPVSPPQSLVLRPLPTRTPGRGTHKLIASLVHVVLQVAAAIVGGQDGSQLPIASKVEAVVRGEHQQPCDVAPADFLLSRRWGDLPRCPLWGPHRGQVAECVPAPPLWGFWGRRTQTAVFRTQAGTSFSVRVPMSGPDSSTRAVNCLEDDKFPNAP